MVKDKIKDDTKNLSGVYLILNLITDDFYIGSASTDKFYTRFYRHLINLTSSKVLKLAVRKYGLKNFSFMILELYPEKVTVENNKNLLVLEDFYLKSLLPNYNILTEAGFSFDYKHTELDRIKMKSNYSKVHRNKIGNLNRGKKLNKATKERMKQSVLSKKNPMLSLQAIENMKKSSKPVIIYNKGDRIVYGEYNSITNAALSIKCNIKTIHRALKSEKKILLKRWIVSYK